MILHLDKLESFVLDLVDTTNINIIKDFKFVHDSIFLQALWFYAVIPKLRLLYDWTI